MKIRGIVPVPYDASLFVSFRLVSFLLASFLLVPFPVSFSLLGSILFHFQGVHHLFNL